LKKEEAEELKMKLMEIGAEVVIEEEKERKETMPEQSKVNGQFLLEPEEEVMVDKTKTYFDLKLVRFDKKDRKVRMMVIKEVRAIGGLRMMEARELVDGAPTVIKKSLKKEEAEELKIKLTEIGAEVDIEEGKEPEEQAEATTPEQIKTVEPVLVESEEEVAADKIKTFFNLKLVGFDTKSRIKVMKEVRAIGGLKMREAKALVDGAPRVIKKGLKKEEAEELMTRLIKIGAEVEISDSNCNVSNYLMLSTYIPSQ